MVMLGARGDTATQISECLKTQDCRDDVHSQFDKLLGELNKPGAPFALSVANRLFGDQSYQFLQEFLTQTRTNYKSELESVDFRTKYEETRNEINSWVEKQTQGKIKGIIAKGELNNMTRLVLVNAIYFKGTWDEPFLKMSTYNGQFWLNKVKLKNLSLPDTIFVQKSDIDSVIFMVFSVATSNNSCLDIRDVFR
uniref:Serpin domain-containing protein n=1 Tax=Nothobranchius furzeri TaxID=105023 RepID=A0A1A8AD03_NOTFU